MTGIKENGINPIDPKVLPSNMRYFPRISQNSLKIPPKFRANTQIQSVNNVYLFIKTKLFLLHLMWNFIGFNLIYWSSICGQYFLDCSFLEKCGKIWKNGCFSRRLRPDWGKNARAATAGLGSKGLNIVREQIKETRFLSQVSRSYSSHLDGEPP